jgi:hypothetical protein
MNFMTAAFGTKTHATNEIESGQSDDDTANQAIELTDKRVG